MSVFEVYWANILDSDFIKYVVGSNLGNWPSFCGLLNGVDMLCTHVWQNKQRYGIGWCGNDDQVKSVGPACRSRTCSVWMINLVTWCLPWRMRGCIAEKDSFEFCCLPPTRSRLSESKMGCTDSRALDGLSGDCFFGALTSSAKYWFWTTAIQYLSASDSSWVVRLGVRFLCSFDLRQFSTNLVTHGVTHLRRVKLE